jgi:hypothetical protein
MENTIRNISHISINISIQYVAYKKYLNILSKERIYFVKYNFNTRRLISGRDAFHLSLQ